MVSMFRNVLAYIVTRYDVLLFSVRNCFATIDYWHEHEMTNGTCTYCCANHAYAYH